MPHKTSYKYILLSDFTYKEEGVFNNYFVNRYGEIPVYGAIFVYSGS
jgi:hypothetical protein